MTSLIFAKKIIATLVMNTKYNREDFSVIKENKINIYDDKTVSCVFTKGNKEITASREDIHTKLLSRITNWTSHHGRYILYDLYYHLYDTDYFHYPLFSRYYPIHYDEQLPCHGPDYWLSGNDDLTFILSTVVLYNMKDLKSLKIVNQLVFDYTIIEYQIIDHDNESDQNIDNNPVSNYVHSSKCIEKVYHTDYICSYKVNNIKKVISQSSGLTAWLLKEIKTFTIKRIKETLYNNDTFLPYALNNMILEYIIPP
jgi:hypothetical protein